MDVIGNEEASLTPTKGVGIRDPRTAELWRFDSQRPAKWPTRERSCVRRRECEKVRQIVGSDRRKRVESPGHRQYRAEGPGEAGRYLLG